MAGDFHPDGHGRLVYFPLAELSFADTVVSYSTGTESPEARSGRSEESLGAPDYDSVRDVGHVSLGCRGALVLRFDDNALVDVPGPDLHVFEIGPSVEPTHLAVSRNGEDWVEVGRIEGGTAHVDLAGAIPAGESYRYVRLTDLGSKCGGRTPGADIDAVGAIGSARRMTLESEVLFDVDRDEVKPEAEASIAAVAAEIADMEAPRVLIEGHADSDGSEEHNLDLSRRRAASVMRSLTSSRDLEGVELEAVGRGEAEPVASNRTAEGRRANRRVEIVIFPTAASNPSLDGVWTTTGGATVFRTDPDGTLVATYEGNEGRFFLRPSGGRMVGFWAGKSSKQACTESRYGSRHWGRFEVDFDASQRSFRGSFGYCDGPATAGTWTGSR